MHRIRRRWPTLVALVVAAVLAAPTLKVTDPRAAGGFAAARVRELTPGKLRDLFEGDQLVLLGQYVGDEPLTFTLGGNYFGQPRTFTFNFNLDKATTRNAFVPRLWASRQIATLTDAVRDLGADNATAASNPKVKELVDEIVRLSKEFGILTEYTAFLAREGSDLSQPVALASEALRNFDQRVLQTRSGYAAVNQEFNNSAQRDQSCVNPRNGFWDANMNRVAISAVQQVNDRAFYRRGNRWVDSALVEQAAAAPGRTVEFGSDEFRRLATRLAEQNRQGCIALAGEVLLQVDGETVLVK